MTDDKLKRLIREMLSPVLDELCNMTYTIYGSMTKQMGSMPEEQADKIITDLLKAHGDTLVHSIKAGVPKDLDKQIKEAMDARK